MPKFFRLPKVLMFAFLGPVAISHAQDKPSPFGAFRETEAWVVNEGILKPRAGAPQPLITRASLADMIASFEYRAPAGSAAMVYLQGRYGVDLPGNGEWQQVSLRFRAPRFDDGFKKEENALALEVRIANSVSTNRIFDSPSANASWAWEELRGPLTIRAPNENFELRNFRIDAVDFSPIKPPAASGQPSNEKDLVDFVALGKETFDSVGCSACHLVANDEGAVSTGPVLFGLMRREPRQREITDPEGHRFSVKVGREYLQRAMREPGEQLAVNESGPKKGEAFLPLMPAFGKDLLSDQQIEAIGDYLLTLNEPRDRGPIIKLSVKAGAPPYDPMADRLHWLVDDRVRMQRGPMPGTSGRAIHVGNPNGVHYSFDPRLLAIVKIWQGGFLDMSGELVGRGGRGLALGFEARALSFGDREYLFAPLDATGKPIDFSFKETKYGDSAAMREALMSTEDHLARLQAIDAAFLGYERLSKDKLAAPTFRYRVGGNNIEVKTQITDKGVVTITVTANLKTPQSFALNLATLRNARAASGKLTGDRWTIQPGKSVFTLRGELGLAASAWKPTASNYKHGREAMQIEAAKANMPAGYSIESWYPPKDNYGREQLFEALGLARAKDDTLVVGARNAGIWRIVKGEWRLFAEGLFDSLGVQVEDDHGLTVIAGQKAEITRLTDLDGDQIADRYQTVFDAHSYHGNYHSYMHGPVRGGDGNYYIALNLAHDSSGTAYNAGSGVMGTWGGYLGWVFRVEPNGRYTPIAGGLRSPASLGVGPDGRVFYTDNQGDYVGTSKLFLVEPGKFYGHPASLVDLPGMTPASPEITWERVQSGKAREIVMFPHNRVANSPGNPAWDLTGGKFGAFAGQMFIGDQTQSNLVRVALQTVDGVEQGSVMPFMDGLESGVMRPLFLTDGSLLLGQTGRGWQAKGGKIAALQHVRWDGSTVTPAIVDMRATPTGFTLNLTHPLAANVSAEKLQAAVKVASWTYRDAPQYGSDELGVHDEKVTAVSLSADRKTVDIKLASLVIERVHPQQTARIYHAALASAGLFGGAAPEQMNAYYTLHRFPAKQ